MDPVQTHMLVYLVISMFSLTNAAENTKILPLTTATSCVLPPYPEFGNYIISYPGTAQPGDMYNKLRLNYTCNAGYNLAGKRNVNCLNGIWSEQLPRCTKSCRLMRQAGVEYSCGEAGTSGDIRSCAAHVQDGSTVTPRCSGPYYQSRFPLKPMTCEDGNWTNVPECKPVCGLRVQGHDESVKVPWHAGIFFKHVYPYLNRCSGSIVARNLVISATTCFIDSERNLQAAANFFVGAGKLYRVWYEPNQDKAQQSEIDEIKISPWYTGSSTSHQHDIALVFLHTPFEYNEYVWPICLDFDEDLDKKQLLEGRSGIVASWDSSIGDFEDVLQDLELPNVDVQRCAAEALNVKTILAKQPLHVTSDKICAGHNTSTPLCEEHYGAGYAVSEPDTSDSRKRRYFLRGVVTLYNKLVCIQDFYTVFTKISAHENFIKANSARVIF